jgi:hypothetical protein
MFYDEINRPLSILTQNERILRGLLKLKIYDYKSVTKRHFGFKYIG